MEGLPPAEVVAVKPNSRVAIVAIPADVVFRFPPVIAAVADDRRGRPLIAASADVLIPIFRLVVVTVITILRGSSQRSDSRHGKKKTSKSESLQHGFRASLSFEVGFLYPNLYS
jgi:hypothetical protein